MKKKKKFNLDVENLKNDLAIENMYVTDDDISMLRKISNNEITMNQAIHDIIKGDYNVWVIWSR